MIVTLLAGTILAGCGTPTKAGIEARKTARTRIDRVNAELAFEQAEQAFEAGQFEKAAKEVRTAIHMHPEWAPYRLLEGRIHMETHRLEKALESYTAALQLKPDYADAHYYSGIIYQRWSDDAKAYEAYMAAFEMDPASVQYLLAGAESMVALGQYNAARQLVESKLTYFEHNSALRHLLGQIAMLQDDPETAADLLTDARRLNPEEEAILEELVQAQYAAGRFGDCYLSVGELQLLNGEKRWDLVLLEARCLALMDRLVESRNLYLELSKQRSTDADVWVELGAVAWDLGDFHRMALSGARVTALAPDRFEGYLLKGINERHHGNLQEAAMLLRLAAEHGEGSALPHLVLGRVLEETGDNEAALDAYAEAVRVQPDSVEAQALFGALSGQLIAAEETDRAGGE
jgi:tetratricopeptide (TPR) repeat protein